MASRPNPVLICLPHGLSLGGVTAWALRLAGGLAQRGRAVALACHRHAPGEFNIPIPSGVVVHAISAGPIDSCAGDYSAFLPAYLDAIDRLAARWGEPVALLPNLSAECYGLSASLTRARPGMLRLVAWTHSRIEHDFRLAEHYAPMIGRFAGVSERITRDLRERLPERSADVRHVPYGVPVPASPPKRPSIAGRPVRLVYAGRLDHFQKRVGVLPILSHELTGLGVAHELTIIGAGPAGGDIARVAEGNPTLRLLPPASPAAIAGHLARADFFVLPSRFEGLSISMLEAMAQGCVPIITHVESGAEDVVAPGVSGELVGVCPDDTAMARALAEAVVRALGRGVGAMSHAAWRAVNERFALETHLDAAERTIDEALSSPARDWPSDRPCAPTRADGTGFTVPLDAPERARAALADLAGRLVALWGAGRHTAAIAPALTDSPARVVAIIDDDPSRHGGTLAGLPIASAADAARLGATDVLISSAIHEEALWARRGELERLGLGVHRMYREDRVPAPAPRPTLRRCG